MRSLFVLLVILSFSWAVEGKEVYEKKCAKCHAGFIPMATLKKNYLDYNNTLLNLKAPTLNQLSYRLKQRIGDPKGDSDMHRMEVEAFISEYVNAPNRQKSLCLEEVMVHFETMPGMKGQVSEEELEAVSEYIYEFDTKLLKEKSVSYEGFDEALKKAQLTGKMIMLKVMAKDCHFCRKMDREVLIDPEVVAQIEKGFIPVVVDISKSELPLGLHAQLTPSFIFIDSDATVLLNIPGAWKKWDFLQILEEAKKKKEERKK